ncbi:MAG: SUMF1/EgtB/PvdO family nonheme iron enzyme [Anaerolineae bacterium]|nr:SUMF1/EgtB/PvdO family nonheme iron enzyme [Anaerolineae bacterium]
MRRWFCLLMVLTTIGSATFQDETVVTLPALALSVGETHTLEAQIDCQVEACTAFEVTLEYDPAMLQIDSATIGPYLGNRVFEAENAIDSQRGIIWLAAAVLAEPPVNPDPILFRLSLTALKTGSTRVQVTELKVADLIGQPVPAVAIDTEVTIGQQSEVALIPSAPPSPVATPTPTLDIVQIVETLDAQSTAAVRATEIVGTMTQAASEAKATQTQSSGLTATALSWTDTPTPDITASVVAYLAQRAGATRTQEARNITQTAAAWSPTPTPTSTKTATRTPTPTYTKTPTVTPTPAPPGYPGGPPITANDQWQPVIQAFDGVEMALVPAGSFMMGITAAELKATLAECVPRLGFTGCPREFFAWARPQTRITFDTPFWIDRYEVTNDQFAAFGGQASSLSHFTGANRPREMITWFEARDFCTLRGARLPTEAEWEYVARGPDDLIYPWGDTWKASALVWGGNSAGRTAVVGSRPAGASWVGALDTSGNVQEWVGSLSLPYPYRAADGRERVAGSSNANRMIRGGSWVNDPGNRFPAWIRLETEPSFQDETSGFRCARAYSR